MADVFVSYKKEERERMRPVAEALIALRATVWFDAQLQPGKSFSEEIRQELDACRAQIVLWSKASLQSEWVTGEAEIGRKRRILVPILVEECDLPPPFNILHTESLINWDGDPDHPAWISVVHRLADLLGRPGLPDLRAIIKSSDEGDLKRWLLANPTDVAAADISKRLDASNSEQPKSDLPIVAPPTTLDAGDNRPPMSQRELQSATEAAEFRLRVYRDAARRFGWSNSDEERRLEVEAQSLRAKLNQTTPAQTPAAINKPIKEPAAKSKKKSISVAFVAILGLVVATPLLWLAGISGDQLAPAGESDRQTAVENEDALQQLLTSLGDPGDRAAVEAYAGDFEAVGLDPRWAAQLNGNRFVYQYREGEREQLDYAYSSVRTRGLRVAAEPSSNEALFVLQHQPCQLMNGVATDFRAYLVFDGVAHEGCARRGLGQWPLDESGSETWTLPPLTEVYENHDQ